MSAEIAQHRIDRVTSARPRAFYASMPDVYSSYALIRLLGAPAPPVLAYCSGTFVDVTKVQRKVVADIGEVELSILSFGAFLQAVCVSPVKQFPFSI